MIIVLKQNTKPEQLENLEAWIHSMGIETHVSIGKTHTIIGLVGDTSQVDMDLVRALDIVENVKRIQEPFKNANRKFHNEDLVVDIGGVSITDGNTLDEQIAADERRQKIEKEIAKLEKQARAEKQPKKKFELVQRIRTLQKQLDLL